MSYKIISFLLFTAIISSCGTESVQDKWIDSQDESKDSIDNKPPFVEFVEEPIVYTPIDESNYPYDIPYEDSIVKVEINTTSFVPFNNKQLALNCTFQTNTGINKGYNSSQSQAFVRWYNPVMLRFPPGAWANFYDWEGDNRNRHGDNYNNGEFTEQCDNNPNYLYGIDGLNSLHKSMGFDILWIWNLNYYYKEKAVEQLQNYLNRGFQVKDIELGNELFYRTQRASLTSTPDKIKTRAKSFAQALKDEKEDLRFAIPIAWKNGGADNYNSIMMQDQSYFDALVMHLYYGNESQNEDPGEGGNSGTVVMDKKSIKRMFTARNKYKYEAERIHQKYNTDKPFWLTEWGVTCGRNAASYLGMADTYLYFFQNLDLFEYVVWFQTHGLNPFFETGGTVGKPLYTKTGYGAVYELLEDVFRDSYLLETKVISAQFEGDKDLIQETSKDFDVMDINVDDYKVNAVNCMPVKDKDGTYSLFFVNKRNRPITIDLNIDGKNIVSSGDYEYLNFNSLSENPEWLEQQQGSLNFGDITKKGLIKDGKIILRSLSITVIKNVVMQ